MWFYVRICKAANHSIPDVNVGVLVQYEKLFFCFILCEQRRSVVATINTRPID